MRKSKNKRVIPGFGLSFGITITMLGLIVIIPLCSLVVFSAKLSFPEFLDTITRPRVLSSYAVSFFTAFVAAAIDAVMGMIIAWVLVRYDFPGKAIMDASSNFPICTADRSCRYRTDTPDHDGGLGRSIFSEVRN